MAIAVDLVREVGQIDPALRPPRPVGQQSRLFGRAVTVLCEAPDFGAVLHALDVIEQGQVLVIDAGGYREAAMIGDILSGHLRRKGAAGVVCDGAVRDVRTLGGWDDFPVFARWINPRGPTGADRGAVNLRVTIGGASVAPGDLVIGDDDGLVSLSPMQKPNSRARSVGPRPLPQGHLQRMSSALLSRSGGEVSDGSDLGFVRSPRSSRRDSTLSHSEPRRNPAEPSALLASPHSIKVQATFVVQTPQQSKFRRTRPKDQAPPRHLRV